jgi:hypothetical protein
MGGASVPLGNDWKLLPQVLFKRVEKAPLDIDLALLAQFEDRISLGVNYRYGGDSDGPGESIDILTGIHISSSLMIGLSYDFSLSDIREYQDGSIELFVGYTLVPKQDPDKIINPRFF